MSDVDNRILVWAPARDGRLTCEFLESEGFVCCRCASWGDFCREWLRGAAAVVIAAEMLTESTIDALGQFIEDQPRWSDPPVIVVGHETPESALARFATVGNISLLQRPLQLNTLRSTVQAALRARRRQYQVRDLLRHRDEAERRKDEFLAMLAHELRNPLAPLRTGVQVLQMKPPADAAAQTMKMMERQLVHMSRLIDDLLDVSRIARGRITLSKAAVDVCEVVSMSVEAARSQASQKGLALDVTLPSKSVIVDADRVRLEQMVSNLLNNAVKFTPEGGSIGVSVTKTDRQALIRVSDTGVGIPVDQLSHVFHLFAQAPRSIDRSLGGLGIGLTVVKLLAEQHGGQAEIFSHGDGAGTQAIIRLPLSHASVAETIEAAPVVSNVPRRVLVIEDNHDAADALAIYLKQLGHQVAVEHDGRSGLDTALRDKPEVIICDVGLPVIDGYEIASRLRQHSDFKSCLLIAMTGYGDALDRDRSSRAGFVHHLTKPADPRRVAELVAGGAATA